MVCCVSMTIHRKHLKPRAIPCFVLAAAIALVCAPLLFATRNSAQNPPQTGAASPNQTETLPNWSDPEFAKFVYSVVSIKPFKTDDNTGMTLGTHSMPDGYTAAFPIQGLIYEAYKTDHYRIVGGTGGVFSELYLVQAKMDPDVMEALQKLPQERRRIARQHMLQVLLRDYFKVVVRTEIRDVPAYDLEVAKKGPKLTQAADANRANQKFKWSPDGDGTTTSVSAQGQPADSILAVLSAETGRPVYDKTGLTGVYDFTLKYTPKQFLMDSQPPGDATPSHELAPPIEKALEDQLGLRLVSTTGQLEFIIIDHAERPIGN